MGKKLYVNIIIVVIRVIKWSLNLTVKMPLKIINFIIVTKEKWDVEVWQYMIFIIKEEFRVYKECNFKIDHENINFWNIWKTI